MDYSFSADEIFVMAEQLERNGAKFYRSAAEKVSDSSARDFLLELASMEEQHEKTFARLKAELTDQEKQPTVFDPEGQTGLYLRALADTGVFFEKKIDTSSMEEIFKEALKTEKDSILFYLGIKEMVPERLGKSRLDEIIKEEMDHIRIIGNKLRSLKK
jgi:rubrerythrin